MPPVLVHCGVIPGAQSAGSGIGSEEMVEPYADPQLEAKTELPLIPLRISIAVPMRCLL